MSKFEKFRNKKKYWHLFLSVLVFLFITTACDQKSTDTISEESTLTSGVSMVKHPEWSYNLSIYEVNLRQYSPAGTFAGFEKHLPRLKELGVGIIWIMPIHPIGEKNRKGSMGSYYSVKDYLAVNPEHGTFDEFKLLVKKIHEMDMYVILDWVANHTAWDNAMATEHPDWFTKDENGNFAPPVPDWSDVIDLNYDNPDLREYMLEALKFWVAEANIDGYRCDFAGGVPTDFWNKVREELDKIKPVFMLAEWEIPEHHEKAFDMSYGWEMNGLINSIAKGEKTVADIDAYLAEEVKSYPRDAYRMYFTTNHDENSWNGTVFERLGDGVEAFAVLTATLYGMPLIYSGQEAGLIKRLAFFEKDAIEWKAHKFTELYSTLLNLKRTNKALWNGERGGALTRVHTSNDQAVFSFVREKDDDKVFVIINFSDGEQNIAFQGVLFPGDYTNVFTGTKISFSEGMSLKLKPWEYRVFVK